MAYAKEIDEEIAKLEAEEAKLELKAQQILEEQKERELSLEGIV